MKNRTGPAAKMGIMGALISALFGSATLLAISCCAGPILFLSIGLGWAGLTKFQALAPYRWIFFALSGIFFAIAFYKLYFSRSSCEDPTDCSSRKSIRYQRIALWLSLLIIVASLLFPILFERYLTEVHP